MSTLSLRLPESLHAELAKLAKAEGVSLNQLIATAAAEKLSALKTEEYLQKRARRSSIRKARAALAKVPDASPIPGDELPPGYERGALKKLSKRRAK